MSGNNFNNFYNPSNPWLGNPGGGIYDKHFWKYSTADTWICWIQ